MTKAIGKKGDGFVGSWYFIVIEIVLLVIALGVGIYFALGGKVAYGAPSTNLKTPDSMFYNAISQKNANVSLIEGMISDNLSKNPQVSISYTGNASFRGNGLGSFSNLGVSIPIGIYYTKYYNDSRFDVRIYVLGGINVSFFTINGIRYICSSGAPASLGSAYNSQDRYRCMESNPAFGNTSASQEASVTSVLLPARGIIMHSAEQVRYDGDQCTLTSGTFLYSPGAAALGIVNTTGTGALNGTHGNYSICFSDSRLIPDMMNVSADSGGGVVSFEMRLESVNYTSSEEYVTTLPGPVTPLGK